MVTDDFKAAVERAAAGLIRNTLRRLGGPVAENPDRLCILKAAAGRAALLRHGAIAASFQGGSAFWPVVKPECDDGVSPNRYGYEWTLTDAVTRLMAGEVPEVHAWVAFAFPVSQVWILDLSAGSFARLGAAALGIAPAAVLPTPEAFWHRASDSLPFEVEYRADANATAAVASLSAELLAPVGRFFA